MRIAHVLGSLDFGGVETMALRLLRRLGAYGLEQIVINMGHSPAPRESDFGRLPASRLLTCQYESPHRFKFIAALVALLRRERPDRILAYNFGNHALVAIAARLAGIPATYVQVAGSPLRDRGTKWKSMFLAHLARPFCQAEIAISSAVRNELVRGLKLPADRVRLISYGCEVEQIQERAAQARCLRLDSKLLRILMVSRMDDAKDHPTLLRAIASLIEEGLDLEVVLLGDGPYKSRHQAMAKSLGIAPVALFLGSRDDVPEWMGKSDILVHATHTEGFGSVLIEAMAAEIPVVATDVPACREVLDEGRCGVLVQPANAELLAATIRSLRKDSARCLELTAAAALRVRELYHLEEIARQYVRLLSAA